MAASDRAMLHALTAPATGKTATAPTTSTMAATDAAPLSWSGCACGWKTASVGREMSTRPIRWRGGASGFL